MIVLQLAVLVLLTGNCSTCDQRVGLSITDARNPAVAERKFQKFVQEFRTLFNQKDWSTLNRLADPRGVFLTTPVGLTYHSKMYASLVELVADAGSAPEMMLSAMLISESSNGEFPEADCEQVPSGESWAVHGKLGKSYRLTSKGVSMVEYDTAKEARIARHAENGTLFFLYSGPLDTVFVFSADQDDSIALLEIARLDPCSA